MIHLHTAVRAHVALHRLIEGKSFEFLSPAIFHSPKTQKLAAAYENLTANTLKFKAKSYYYWPKPMFQSIKVDGQEVATSFMMQTKSNVLKQVSHFVDEESIVKSAKLTSFDFGDRNAYEIDASRIEIQYGPDFDREIVSELRKIAPRGKQLVPKLYNMQIHEPGGYSPPHRVTLRAKNHHANLVVALPTKYEGGEFILNVDGEEKSIDLSGDASNKFACFLTDLTHEVRQLKTGIRIVLQYDVYLEDGNPVEDKSGHDYVDFSEESALQKTPTIMESLAKVVKKNERGAQTILSHLERFMKKRPKDSVCFLLCQQYPLDIESHGLKAADRVLYDLVASKYDVELGLALNTAASNSCGEFPSILTGEARKLEVMDFQSSQAFLKQFNETDKHGRYEENVFEEVEKGKVHVFVGNTSFFHRVKAKSSVEYRSPGVYVYASIVLCVGPRR